MPLVMATDNNGYYYGICDFCKNNEGLISTDLLVTIRVMREQYNWIVCFSREELRCFCCLDCIDSYDLENLEIILSYDASG